MKRIEFTTLLSILLISLSFFVVALLVDFSEPNPPNDHYQNISHVFINVSINESFSTYGFIDWNFSVLTWLTMEHTSGSTVFDNSSHKNNGTSVGGALQTSNGRFGNGFVFDGINDAINITVREQIVSLSFWYTNSSIGWFHIVNASGTLYVNGTLATPPRYPLFTDAGFIYAGRLSTSEYFNGTLDDILFFNRNLTTQEVLALYNSTFHQLYNNFTSLTNQTYHYTTYGVDENGNVNSSSQNVTVDTVKPILSLVNPANETINHSDNTINFYYTVSDTSPIGNCTLTINSTLNKTVQTPSKSTTNNITTLLGNGFYVWFVSCTDFAGNSNSTEQREFTLDLLPDLDIQSVNILLPSTLTEGDNFTINATIRNIGLGDSSSFNVSFFEGHYTLDEQIGGNILVNSLDSGENITVYINWTAKQGATEIYVVVDPPLSQNGSIAELTESNNADFTTATISISHIIVGNISGSLVLNDDIGTSLTNWEVVNSSNSKIYVADFDSTINFNSLHALGRNLSNETTIDDFQNLDTLLNTTNSSDSINNTYTSESTPKNEFNFTIFDTTVFNVPIINSTNSSSFFTGILWDYSDDDDGEFDTTDREDIVFITQTRDPIQGLHGFYSFEIKVPANLRNYVSSGDSSSVAIYGEIR